MSIKSKMAKGASWLVSARLMNKGIGFISTMILARLLVPSDFGLVAMAMVIVTILQIVNTYSMQVFLVQKDDLTRNDLNAAWTLQIIFGLFQGVILVLVSGPMAKFFDEMRLVSIYWALAGMMFLYGFKNIGVMYFQREMRFHMEFLLIGARKIGSFIITLTLALIFRSYWALIIGIITGNIIEVVLSYVFHSYRPGIHLKNWKELFKFTKWIYINNILNFMKNKGPQFIIGKLCSSGSLGIFSVSYDIAMLPTTEMVAPINRAIFPGYASMREDEGALREGYLSVLSMIALIALPCAFGIAATADVMIPLLLGSKWVEAVPIVKILALSGGFVSLQSNSAAVYIGKGMPWISTYVNALWVPLVLILIIIFTMYWNIIGSSLAFLCTSIIMFPVNIIIIISLLKIKLTQYLKCIYRPLVCSLVMFYIVNFRLMSLIQNEFNNNLLFTSCILIIFGILIYAFCVLFLWFISGKQMGAEKYFIKLLTSKIETFLINKNLLVKAAK